MKRADLRLIREDLERIRAALLRADRCSTPGAESEQTYAFAVGYAEEGLARVIERLPDAAANAGRAERLAAEARHG